MNAPRFFQFFFLLAALLGLGLARAQAYDQLVATSPDHPTTWVNGATRVHQNLRWSKEKNMLYGDVTYSTADYADNAHPTESNDFSLAFPSVHFDAATGKFTANGTVVATLQHGLFGDSVALA